uniref:Uncharacterized protein n=1 Tax=Escherichia coli TaxID=562 RepID=A0A343J0R4_ECOLX|nr:hypothetical protein ECSA44_05584 [Escherichia coli]
MTGDTCRLPFVSVKNGITAGFPDNLGISITLHEPAALIVYHLVYLWGIFPGATGVERLPL